MVSLRLSCCRDADRRSRGVVRGSDLVLVRRESVSVLLEGFDSPPLPEREDDPRLFL